MLCYMLTLCPYRAITGNELEGPQTPQNKCQSDLIQTMVDTFVSSLPMLLIPVLVASRYKQDACEVVFSNCYLKHHV